jgi:hypothetical protein
MSSPPDPKSGDRGAEVLEDIRRASARVAEEASFIEIDHERLAGYFDQIEGSFALEMDSAIHFRGEKEDTVAFFLTLDSVNFGSGYFPEILNDPRMSGYRTIASALTDHFRAEGPLPATALRALTLEECTRLFRLDPFNPLARELAGLFAQALNDLGHFLINFDESFGAVVEKAGGSAGNLVSFLAQMPLFRDVASYHGGDVPFYKRAQIAAADLFIAFDGKGPGRFDDIDRLTLFADNLVPHVLRQDGLLRYDPALAARVDRGELLQAGSPEEVEIRACAVHAVELLVDEAHRRKLPLNALQLDNYLWHRGQQPHFRTLPRHRTLTCFY